MIHVAMPGRACGRAMRSAALLAVLAAVLGGSSPARGADAPGRYTMTPTVDGALRLDTVTGEVSACSRTEGERWACRAVADERPELRKELDRLTAENKALAAEIERLKQPAEPEPEPELEPDAEPEPPGSDEEAGGGRSWLPDQQVVERVMAYFQGMMRRFQARLETFWERVQQSAEDNESW